MRPKIKKKQKRRSKKIITPEIERLMPVIQRACQSFKAPENITVSEWADKYRIMQSENSAEVGKWRAARTPYMKEIMDSVCYEHVRKGLDAVRVPFGVCFKPAKLACRTQLKHCLECASFCSTRENEIEYREEIKRVGAQIAIGKRIGRQEWVDKNQEWEQSYSGKQIYRKGYLPEQGAGSIRVKPYSDPQGILHKDCCQRKTLRRRMGGFRHRSYE